MVSELVEISCPGWLCRRQRGCFKMNQQTSMTSPEQCPGYQECTAPLCFMDKSLTQACWYPGEPVCKLRQVPKWVKTQRRIAKALGIPKDADKGQEHYGAFSVQMLESVKRITSKIRGVDFESETEQAWLNKRPSFGVKGGITDITKTVVTPGPMFGTPEKEQKLVLRVYPLPPLNPLPP